MLLFMKAMTIGEVAKAKKAYKIVQEKHATHVAAAYATNDLIDIATEQGVILKSGK